MSNTDNSSQRRRREHAVPFLKWVGGKTQLLPRIREQYPSGFSDGTVDTYVEPFLGGGAVFFDVMNTYRDVLRDVVINDVNANIVNAYRVVRDDVEALVEDLRAVQERYLSADVDSRASMFHELREEYNDVIMEPLTANDVRRASLLIFLNKTCFNGLYRVNKRGRFNSPHGRYASPRILNEENLRASSSMLDGVTVLNGDYDDVSSYVDYSRSFVYLDPPYRPVSRTASFNSYDSSVFDDEAQGALGDFVRDADSSGAHILLSNSDPKNVDPDDDFFDDLYAGFTVSRVPARRSVSSKASTRGAIHEVLVSNYGL